jgi:HSP20 family protein
MVIIRFKPNPNRQSYGGVDGQSFFSSAANNWSLASRTHVWRPPTDVYENEDRFVVRLEIAGMHENDIHINIDENILSISGVRNDPTEERRAYHQMEIHYGEFLSEFSFTTPIDIDRVTAEYHNGLLLVFIPKSQPRQIDIT